MKKFGKGNILVIIIILAAIGVGLYMYFDSTASDKSTDEKNKKYYKELEKKLVTVAEDYIKNEYTNYDTINTSILIEEGYLKEEDLEVKKAKDKCTGYVDVSEEKYKAYIKCGSYKTSGYVAPIISTIKTVTYEVVNKDSLSDEISIQRVDLSKEEVVIRGEQDIVAKVDSVKALLDVDGAKIEDKGGSTRIEFDEVTLKAYDKDGEVVSDVEIVATNLMATIYLDANSKSVPIKIQYTGNLAYGKAIESILINDESSYDVSLFGDEDAIDKISHLPVTIDIDGLGSSEKEYKVNLTKPSGVKKISEETITIKLTFGDAKQKKIKIGIETMDLAEGLTANVESEDTVEVTLTGTESVLEDISQYDIHAYIDFSGYREGTYEIPVLVESDDPRVNCSVSSKIKVIISKE